METNTAPTPIWKAELLVTTQTPNPNSLRDLKVKHVNYRVKDNIVALLTEVPRE